MSSNAELGVPAGTVELAAELWSEVGGPSDGSDVDTAVLELLTAPRRLEPDWPDPPEPVAVGCGWVHAEVIDDDRPLFDALLAEPSAGPEALATTAQQLRLPVNPYRSLQYGHRAARSRTVSDLLPFDSAKPQTECSGRMVIDLSSHWAGPLATRLLASAGATVIKVDPDCRPDGFRSRTNLYHHLNDGKDILDLDLRSPIDRRDFEHLVSDADLLVESFSDRVMENLGYSPDTLRALNPTISTLSIRAFAADGPDAGRLAYGPGVHAASGLGTLTGTPLPAALAYADPLTALRAYGQALALCSAAERPSHVLVSLRETIEPLVAEALRTEAIERETANG